MSDRKQALEFLQRGLSVAQDKSQPNNQQVGYTLIKSACIADPNFDNAWYHAGNANHDLGLSHSAIACWRRAIEQPPYSGLLPATGGDILRANALVNMSVRLHQLGRSEEARPLLEQALDINPKLALAWGNLSLIESIAGNHAQAIAAARHAVELEPTNATLEMTLSFALLFAGQIQEGLKHYEARFRYRLPQFLNYPYPPWDGSEGKRLFLVSEQGIGDTLSFARFLPLAAARCSFIHALVHPELIRLFRAMFIRHKNVEFIPAPSPFLPADSWSTFVSLPVHMGLSENQIRDQALPDVPPFETPPVWKAPDRLFHIGIAWGGSAANDIDRHRTIPLHHFLELYRVPGIQLYSLQVDGRAKELHDAGCAALIYDLAPHVRDVADTIGILKHLDLVITCESALGHIAGMVNKTCWIPYSYNGRDYRAGHTGEYPLWYPRHSFFKQGDDARWEPVFNYIIDELRATIDARRNAAAE